MPDHSPCPACSSEFVYQDGAVMICPECATEWPVVVGEPAEPTDMAIQDSAGNDLRNGDSVILIKDLKIKGAAGTLKIGTKVKNIRLVDGDHNIDCKIDGIGALSLKSEFVRKA